MSSRREHNQGRQDRDYTKAQAAAVGRVRKCRPDDFYAILDIEASASEGEIRKAYRKLALIMHPDKNGAPGADEAFKLISRAFQVLNDPQKKNLYDKTGQDPDSRGSSSARGAAGFAGDAFARTGFPGASRGQMPFGAEISPEDLFNMFFGGGGLGGGSGGGLGAQFGGFSGPGIRINTFGPGAGLGRGFGGFAGRRPAGTDASGRRQTGANVQEPTIMGFSLRNLIQLLPLLLLFIVPLTSSLFGDSSGLSDRSVRFEFDRTAAFPLERRTPQYHVPYFVNPQEVSGLAANKMRQLDRRVELAYLQQLKNQCSREYAYKQARLRDSVGWFSTDQEAYEKAIKIPLTSCDQLDELGVYYERS